MGAYLEGPTGRSGEKHVQSVPSLSKLGTSPRYSRCSSAPRESQRVNYVEETDKPNDSFKSIWTTGLHFGGGWAQSRTGGTSKKVVSGALYTHCMKSPRGGHGRPTHGENAMPGGRACANGYENRSEFFATT